MNSPVFLRTAAAIALPLAVTASLIIALGYANEQQILRQGANEPQVQLAESIASEIGQGAPPQAFTQGIPAPLEETQTPFILIADGQGTTLSSTATVGGNAPTLPAGVFGGHKDSMGTSDNRITWQPTAALREALVITPFQAASSTGYVVVGRSLRETENQEHNLTMRTLLGWVGTMVGVLLAALLGAWLLRRER